CEGDPINRYDPTGEAFLLIAIARKFTSFAVKNLVRARNVNINVMTGKTAAMGTKSLKTPSFINDLAGQQKTTWAIPVKTPSHLLAQAPKQNVKTTATPARVSAPAPLQKAQDSFSAPTKNQNEQVFNRIGYGKRDSSNFAAKSIFFSFVVLGGGAAALYFGLKAIRGD
ncbi:hypothetical protein, partial [Pseudomonas asiatica]|uniref:hypothetical protein n=1 Tax=Pseudomonas asiatica TaxID=2219225 RepID=UPI0037C50543